MRYVPSARPDEDCRAKGGDAGRFRLLAPVPPISGYRAEAQVADEPAVLTGLCGAVIGPWLLSAGGISDHRAAGFAFGVAATPSGLPALSRSPRPPALSQASA